MVTKTIACKFFARGKSGQHRASWHLTNACSNTLTVPQKITVRHVWRDKGENVR